MQATRTRRTAAYRQGFLHGLAEAGYIGRAIDAPAAPEAEAAAEQPRATARGAADATAFPALAWLADIVDRRHGWQRIVLIMTPIHSAVLPKPGQAGHDREAACKARIDRIAERARVPFVDFRIVSPITSRDEHYWDALHYRVPIATRIVNGIARALATGEDDPGGDWKVRVRPPAG